MPDGIDGGTRARQGSNSDARTSNGVTTEHRRQGTIGRVAERRDGANINGVTMVSRGGSWVDRRATLAPSAASRLLDSGGTNGRAGDGRRDAGNLGCITTALQWWSTISSIGGTQLGGSASDGTRAASAASRRLDRGGSQTGRSTSYESRVAPSGGIQSLTTALGGSASNQTRAASMASRRIGREGAQPVDTQPVDGTREAPTAPHDRRTDGWIDERWNARSLFIQYMGGGT